MNVLEYGLAVVKVVEHGFQIKCFHQVQEASVQYPLLSRLCLQLPLTTQHLMAISFILLREIFRNPADHLKLSQCKIFCGVTNADSPIISIVINICLTHEISISLMNTLNKSGSRTVPYEASNLVHFPKHCTTHWL